MLWFFLHAFIIFCAAVVMVLGVVSLDLYRRKRKTKKAMIRAEPVFSEYKYVYRNIKED